jgi:hypothetical protein
MTTKDKFKKIERELPVPMTDECVAVRAQELAANLNEQTAIETELAAYGADKRKRLRELRKVSKRLATAVTDHTELAMVDCEERRLFSQNTIEIVRLDTGKVVETRAMKGDERQAEINVEPAEDHVDLDEDEGPRGDEAN